MNERVLALLRFYDQTLANRGIAVVNHSDISDVEALTGERRLEHVRWMLGQMFTPTEQRLDKKFKKERTVNRWLGFIQGVLYCGGIYTISEMRDQSRNLYGVD
jgi:hypothetical protein